MIGAAQRNGLAPKAYRRTVLRRIAGHPINRIDDLLPGTSQHFTRPTRRCVPPGEPNLIFADFPTEAERLIRHRWPLPSGQSELN
ncbi:MAG: transposase domain-containing protein [Gammaproteobacteria bacterium]|nr:transposase domain-containing protein [Gammaproteobacteria bacterium]